MKLFPYLWRPVNPPFCPHISKKRGVKAGSEARVESGWLRRCLAVKLQRQRLANTVAEVVFNARPPAIEIIYLQSH